MTAVVIYAVRYEKIIVRRVAFAGVVVHVRRVSRNVAETQFSRLRPPIASVSKVETCTARKKNRLRSIPYGAINKRYDVDIYYFGS